MLPARCMSMRRNGFSLIEVLVALAVFSLAALALLRLEGAVLGGTARIDDKTIAAIVARNQGIAALLAPQPAAYGASGGTERNAGRAWQWHREVSRTADARLQRIDVSVMGRDGGTAATLTLLRRVG